MNTAAGAKIRDRRAADDAEHGRQRPQPQHAGNDQPLGAMGEIGLDRGRHDDRKRGADAKLHAHRVGHVEDAEHLVEHRHDDRAAADAEQAGEQSGNDAADDDGQREPEQLAQRNAENHFAVIRA